MLGNVMHDNSEIEDLSFAALRYQDGALAQVASSVVHHGEEQGIVLQCENAKIAAPWNCCAETSTGNGFPEKGHNQVLMDKLEVAYQALPDLPYEGHTGEIDDILKALECGGRPMITGVDGRKTAELITAIYKAGCKKQTVTLPLDESDEYYTFEGILQNAIHFNKKGASVENFAPEEITVGTYKTEAE